MPGGEDTGSVNPVAELSDRFYTFATETFPKFSKDTGERLAGLETEMKGVNGRLKKIENGGKKVSITPAPPGGWMKLLPWLITAVVCGAAIGGYVLATGSMP